MNKLNPHERDPGAPDPLAFDHFSIMQEGLMLVLNTIGNIYQLGEDGWLDAIDSLNPKILR